MKLSGPGFLFVVKFVITNSVSIPVQVYLILLCFALLHFADVAFFFFKQIEGL